MGPSEVAGGVECRPAGPAPNAPPGRSRSGLAVALWAVSGVALTFVDAIVRLGARAMHTLAGGLGAVEWLGLGTSVALFSYFEGHRALANRFAPLVVARAFELGERAAGFGSRLLAPLYASCLLGATKRQLLLAWSGVATIAVAVHAVRRFPEPWRGIIDAGVCAALSFGLLALASEALRALRGSSAWDRGAELRGPVVTKSNRVVL